MMAVYLRGLKDGSINATPNWTVTRESPGTATIDSDRGLGLVVGPAAMRLAIEKARECGIGSVVAGNGRHYGAAGYHASLALPHDMIGLSMTVGGLSVLPPFGAKPMVGLNPIAISAPAGKQAPFTFDASMSTAAGNKVRLAARLGVPLPPGWIAESDGTPIMEPAQVPEAFHMLPLGATREMGAHKGFSLAMMVDVLCGLLSGTGPGFAAGPVASHHFLAYRIDAFTDLDTFKEQMDTFLSGVLECPPAPGHDRVIYAGLPESEVVAVREREGIPYHREVVQRFKQWAAEYCIEDRLPAVEEGAVS
jgi:L-2-hydroxycarboxylate dehydrogenase (NAD+)